MCNQEPVFRTKHLQIFKNFQPHSFIFDQNLTRRSVADKLAIQAVESTSKPSKIDIFAVKYGPYNFLENLILFQTEPSFKFHQVDINSDFIKKDIKDRKPSYNYLKNSEIFSKIQKIYDLYSETESQARFRKCSAVAPGSRASKEFINELTKYFSDANPNYVLYLRKIFYLVLHELSTISDVNEITKKYENEPIDKNHPIYQILWQLYKSLEFAIYHKNYTAGCEIYNLYIKYCLKNPKLHHLISKKLSKPNASINFVTKPDNNLLFDLSVGSCINKTLDQTETDSRHCNQHGNIMIFDNYTHLLVETPNGYENHSLGCCYSCTCNYSRYHVCGHKQPSGDKWNCDFLESTQGAKIYGSHMDRVNLFLKIVSFEKENYIQNILCQNIISKNKLLFECLMDIYVEEKFQQLQAMKRDSINKNNWQAPASLASDFLHEKELPSPNNFINLALYYTAEATLDYILDESKCRKINEKILDKIVNFILSFNKLDVHLDKFVKHPRLIMSLIRIYLLLDTNNTGQVKKLDAKKTKDT